jgi:hypothetical protein
LSFLHPSPQRTGPDMRYPSALAVVLLALTGPASATEYLANGGFESGDFSGWDLFDSLSAEDGVVATDNGFLSYGAESGSWFFVSAVSTDSPSFLSQTFSDIAGQQLTVSGWAIGDPNTKDGLGEITYFFNNQELGAPTVTGTWTQSTFQVTATGSDIFEIQFADDESFIGLDNFSVSSGLSSTRDVPEPSTWTMMLIGLIGMGLLAPSVRRSVTTSSRNLMALGGADLGRR